MRTLIKIDRLSAWGLFISMLLYFVTGYGMTKGIIDASLATKLHLSYLTYFVLLFFVIHTSYAIHLAFKRWGIWKSYGKPLPIIFYIIFIGSFVFVDRFYQPNHSSSKQTASSSVASISSSDTLTDNSSASNQQVFSTTELSKYNGQNGQPAYVAVDGIVYDMSSVFINGFHHGYKAGQDLTAAFYDQHSTGILANYPVVGTLK
jgi:predicted heme/steroid binding protein